VCVLKGVVHPKMTFLLSFTHPQVFQNRHEFISSARRYEYPNSRWAPLTSLVWK